MVSDRSLNKVPLKFGTSGLRDRVEILTDEQIYINTRGFLQFLMDEENVKPGTAVALAGDLRPSTGRIMAAVAKAIEDKGFSVDHCGRVPSPAVMYYAMQKSMPSVMVTGSHIPDDRNGVKFSKPDGEVLKTDEKAILDAVSQEREQEWAIPLKEALFNLDGSAKTAFPLPPAHNKAAEQFVRRYLDVFPADMLTGFKVGIYQHSAVGRQTLIDILEGLGAEVMAPTETVSLPLAGTTVDVDLFSKKFVPVDTEKITPQTQAVLDYFAQELQPDAIVSMDGDSDRPLFADEKGEFLPGDKLGFLTLTALPVNPHNALVPLPISTNDGVVDALIQNGFAVVSTKIGSPHICLAMLGALGKEKLNGKPMYKHLYSQTMGWEANGGFLLGTDIELPGGILKALPTRDAVLPLISLMMLCKQNKMKASEFIHLALPPRFNVAGVIDDKTPGTENYTAAIGKKIIQFFSPKNSNIAQAEFDNNQVKWMDSQGSPCKDDAHDLFSIKEKLQSYFSQIGLGDIININWLDGVRVTFENGVIYHLRPSGNAPEFRGYVTADSLKQAHEILQKHATLIAAMLKDF